MSVCYSAYDQNIIDGKLKVYKIVYRCSHLKLVKVVCVLKQWPTHMLMGLKVTLPLGHCFKL